MGFIPTIKRTGKILANYGGNDNIGWVSPYDIAETIAEELCSSFKGTKVRYVISDELSCNDTATLLGNAIGNPDLKWETITDEQMLLQLLSIGMAPNLAAGLVEMNSAMHSGKLLEHFYQHRPTTVGAIKVSDYALEFAKVYKLKNST